MATFYANPNEQNELWIERAAIEGYGFRIWHLMLFCFAGCSFMIIFVCCCIRIRVPRTKQQIEADYRRKKLTDKFKQRLRLIQNHDMDAIDLQRALEIIQEDYKDENRKIECEVGPENYNINENEREQLHFAHAEPQQPASFSKKLANVMRIAKFSSTTTYNTQSSK